MEIHIQVNFYNHCNSWKKVNFFTSLLVLMLQLLYNPNRNIWCECRPPILKKKGGIKTKKRTFIIKVLRYIAIILLLLTLLVIAIKIWHSFISDWVSNLILLEATFTCKIECSSFFIVCKFPWHIHNNIFMLFCQKSIYFDKYKSVII